MRESCRGLLTLFDGYTTINQVQTSPATNGAVRITGTLKEGDALVGSEAGVAGFRSGDHFQRFSKTGLLVVSVLLLLTRLPARGDEQRLASLQVTPRETGVLLLPALDATTDSAHMRAPRQLVVRHREEYEFITRRFKMLGEAMAARAAAAAPGIDLGDLATRTDANLELMARRTGADWVISIVVEEVKLDSSAGNEFKVHTRVRLQVWDARRRGWLANNLYSGQASGSGSPIFVFKNSLDDAIKGSLRNLLGIYPQVVPVLQEDGLNDYLAGQTQPFVGDPKTPFSGLKAER